LRNPSTSPPTRPRRRLARRPSSSRERSHRYENPAALKRAQNSLSGGELIYPQQKKVVSSSRAADQKAIDKALLANIKKVDMLASYLATSFSLRNGDKPHEMKW